MNDPRSRRITGHRALDAAGLLLTIARGILVVASILLVPLGVLTAWGRIGDVTLTATIDEPYTVVFGTAGPGGGQLLDSYVGVDGDNIVTYGNLPIGEENWFFSGEAPEVAVQISVDREDRDTRIVVVLGILIALLLVWAIVAPLRLLVESARDGAPFAVENPGRLRVAAAAVVGLKIVSWIGARIVDRTLDVFPPVRVVDPGPGWTVTVVVIAVALLALAEVFRVGARLQEADDLTV